MIIRLLLVSLGVAALGLCPATSFAGELPKEGTFSVTAAITLPPGSVKEWGTLNKGTARIFEGYLILMNDAGAGIFHKATGHCVGFGSDTEKKGATRNNGECVYTDADGDRIAIQFVQSQADEAAPMISKSTILGGTGKYDGIQGNYQSVSREPLKSGVEDAYYVIQHAKGSYKITR